MMCIVRSVFMDPQLLYKRPFCLPFAGSGAPLRGAGLPPRLPGEGTRRARGKEARRGNAKEKKGALERNKLRGARLYPK